MECLLQSVFYCLQNVSLCIHLSRKLCYLLNTLGLNFFLELEDGSVFASELVCSYFKYIYTWLT